MLIWDNWILQTIAEKQIYQKKSMWILAKSYSYMIEEISKVLRSGKKLLFFKNLWKHCYEFALTLYSHIKQCLAILKVKENNGFVNQNYSIKHFLLGYNHASFTSNLIVLNIEKINGSYSLPDKSLMLDIARWWGGRTLSMQWIACLGISPLYSMKMCFFNSLLITFPLKTYFGAFYLNYPRKTTLGDWMHKIFEEFLSGFWKNASTKAFQELSMIIIPTWRFLILVGQGPWINRHVFLTP